MYPLSRGSIQVAFHGGGSVFSIFRCCPTLHGTLTAAQMPCQRARLRQPASALLQRAKIIERGDAMTESKKKCFVICPFGSVDSDVRKRSDYVYKIICQALEPKGYRCNRTIDDPMGGPIGNQIMGDIRKSDLVIADLTSLNPNVMYELAIRHVTGRPYIHLIERGTKIPFDISMMNYIEIEPDFDRGSEALHLIDAIGAQVEKIESGDCDFANPAVRPTGPLGIQYYVWEVSFRDSVHVEWLRFQDDHIQEFIKKFRRQGSDLAQTTEHQRKKLAEYQAMNERANSVMRGHMFYYYNKKSGAINEGWVVFDEVDPILALAVRGEHLGERIELKYKQPGWPQIVRGEALEVGPYNYNVTFQKQENGDYAGELVHPEEFMGENLTVAITRLFRIPSLIIDDD
jgi:hypothetical protein